MKGSIKKNPTKIPGYGNTVSTFEEKLIASEVRYRRLFESAKDGILMLDAKTGKIIDVNPFLIDLLGFSKEKLIEKEIWEIGFFEDIVANKNKFIELQQQEYVRYENLPLETVDGRKINVEFVSNVYLENHRKIIQCNIRDITKRKKIETGLEKTRKGLAIIKKSSDEVSEFAENIINTVREPLLLLNKQLRVVKASRSFYNFFRVTPDETIGKLIYELGNHQWNIPKLKELLETILPEKTTFENYEVEHDFSEIGKRIMLLNARQIERDSGKEMIILLAIEDITERKLAEKSFSEKNRLTNEYLDILFNHAHVPIIIWDSSSVITRFNHAFEELIGYNWTDSSDKKLDILFPKEKIKSSLELIKNTLNNERPELIEVEIVTKGNEIKTVLWNSTNIFDKEGKNIVATVAQDITKRKRTEEALTISETRLHTLVQTIPDLIWSKDKDGIYLSCNRMFERFFGVAEAEIVGKTDYDFVDRKLADFSREMDRKAMAAGKPTSNEEWITFADDGHSAYLETIKAPMFDAQNKLIGVLGIGRDITERKKAEDALLESEIKYRAFFENSMDAILLTSSDGKTISANQAACNMFGYSEDELIRLGRSGVEDKTDPRLSVLITERELKGKAKGEITFIRKDGTRFAAEISSAVFKNHLGIERTSMIIRDITERKLAEKTLHESEEKYRMIVETTAEGIWVVDKGWKTSYINPAMTSMLGYATEEIIGHSPIEFVVQDEIPKANELMHNREKGITEKTEVRMRRKNGTIIWTYGTSVSLLDDKGEFCGGLSMVSDITESKLDEKEITMLSHSLKSVNECVSITDLDDKILFVNESFLKTYGYDINELIGENIKIVRSHNNDQKKINEILLATIRGEWQGELLNRRKNGSEFPVYLSTSVIKDKESKVLGLIGVATDISERKVAEKELIAAKEKAEESDSLKSAFLANMSHEIRTPMNGILGFTELLREPMLTGEQKEEYIGIIEKSGMRMLNIINDIVSISKIEAGQMEITMSDTDINEQIEDIFNFFKPDAEQKKLQISFKNLLPSQNATIKTDKEKVITILTNLVKNAIKFTSSGSIEFGYEKKGNWLEFFVKDTGIGVTREQKELIFERFRQGSESLSRNYEGAGLGLSISKAYVEVLGGKIWVDNDLDIPISQNQNKKTGSVFYFTLPYYPIQKANITGMADIVNNAIENQVKKLKILIAEDDEIARVFITIVTERFCKEVIKVDNGYDAVEACQNNPDIDLILMDIKMPEMDGYEATRQIRLFNKNVIIIAQTAYGLSRDRDEAIEAGCNDYISKPINQNTLNNLIEKYFN